MKKIVIMPGGFHPFHAGHMALYTAARETFPSADVFVAATADTSTRPFPFAAKKFLAQQAGVPGNRFIQVKSPFRAEEITQMYDPDDTVLIFVRSEKDAQKQPQAGGVKRDGSPAYLQPYKRNKLEPFSQHGYMAYLPTVQFGPGMTSATEIRAKWPEMSPEEKISLVKVMYPSTAAREAAAGKIVSMLDEILGTKIDEMLPILPIAGAALGGLARIGGAAASGLASGLSNALASHGSDSDVEENMQGAQASLLGAPMGGGASTLNPTPTPMANAADRPRKGVRMGVEFDEATLVNDPEAGIQIRPAGGMGTYNEATLVSNLARKFASMVNMVKNKNYSGLHYALYRAGVVENMTRALAELEAFQKQQGRRPIARGREIDITDYVDER
jgi:hypothetical protein